MRNARFLLICAALIAGASLATRAAEPAPKSDDYNLPGESRAKNVPALDAPEPPACLSREEFARLLAAPGLASLLVLTADRDVPLWRTDTVPVGVRGQLSPGWRPSLTLRAQPGEFRVFQLGVLPVVADLAGFDVVVSALTSANDAIPADAARVLSLRGTRADGQPLRKEIAVARRAVHPVWLGIDVPENARGSYRGVVTLVPLDAAPIEMPLTLDVAGEPVSEHGVRESARLARLRWLDSDIAREPTLPRGFPPVRAEGSALLLRGHRVTIGTDGLPSRIESTFSGSNTRAEAAPQPLLAAPVRFVAETESGALAWRDVSAAAPAVESDCAATWSFAREAEGLRLDGDGRIEFDGFGRFRLRVSATRDLALRDLRLEIPYAETAARYFVGLGHAGGARPEAVQWKWDVADKHQEGFWLGAVNNGASWRFRDANYRRPLVNIYYPFRPLLAPVSWDNAGRGGIAFDASREGAVLIRVSSGPRELRRGETLDFHFELSLTPAKPIDTDHHWRERIVHPSESKAGGAMENALAELPESGANLITIHHRKDQNPFINYPYGDAAFPLLADYVRRAHARDARVKVYYTTRELTQHVPELWALDSFGGEIICPGPGPEARTVVNKTGPDPWLSERLRGSFLPAWRAVLSGRFNGARDLAVITTPDSRWNNFYLEGLNYLCRHAAIDGLYLDDTALDRESMLRARRILERRRPAPHVDLHSWNHFKPLGSFATSVLLYTELMPFLDRLWLGESFDYARDADFWLVEVAGIPFGVMSDMLQGGGHPWRGLLFGMTNQLGWNRGDPRPLWRYWDQFGMTGTEMIGWWDEACPVRTDRTSVRATVYRKQARVLIALASWSEQDEPLKLSIDWTALDMSPTAVRARTAAIENFQTEQLLDLAEPIVVPAGRGLLIEVSPQ